MQQVNNEFSAQMYVTAQIIHTISPPLLLVLIDLTTHGELPKVGTSSEEMKSEAHFLSLCTLFIAN